MDTFFTIDEKYLQAVDEFSWGEKPMALRLLNEIIENDATYARAHYLLGKIYYYEMQDYQAAGYHFKTCLELEPSFPGVYYDYMRLAVFLNMENLVKSIKAKALNTAGVDSASIYELSGKFFEKKRDWTAALADYEEAFMDTTRRAHREKMQQSIERVKLKMQQHKPYTYEIVE